MPAPAGSAASGFAPSGTSPAGAGFFTSARSAASAVYAGTTLAVGGLGVALASPSRRRLLTAFVPEPDQASGRASSAPTRSRTIAEARLNAAMMPSNAR
jgi:hypothetical protein